MVVALMCVWVFVSVIASQYVLGWAMIAVLGAETVSQPLWTAIYTAVSYILAMALIILVPPLLAHARQGKQKGTKPHEQGSLITRQELGLAGWPTWTDVGLGPVGFLAATLAAAGLVGLFSVFPWFQAEETQAVGFSAYLTGADRAIAFLTLVVVAPIAEEVIFRGWLYGKIRDRLHGRLPEKLGILIAILLVSVTFGILHGQWNVGINVFALSVVLCVLREVTGTIYAGILAHMIKNGVAFYLLYVAGM